MFKKKKEKRKEEERGSFIEKNVLENNLFSKRHHY